MSEEYDYDAFYESNIFLYLKFLVNFLAILLSSIHVLKKKHDSETDCGSACRENS